ncbi:MAG: AbrB/MazE/SpoVT family DNA-binding domain-containing protein [Silvibacterium sp.]|nr:AbrB/MazE/SpoVT family DNA-binding domain-containing protein [Silvibacterium sp.]
MARTVKVTTVGNSVGIILPKEILARMNLKKGDTLYLTETPDGVQLTPYRADFDETMEVAQGIMRRYRDTLRKLAE